MKKFSITYYNEKNEYYGYDINDTALELARKNIPNQTLEVFQHQLHQLHSY